eukprot:GILI01002751.1.p1 GENE.GILI01002751.1~~GILI01002751.1.p1  ORF type:complete len:225 (+),score=55.17 GILI01002751.1:107-781(+)
MKVSTSHFVFLVVALTTLPSAFSFEPHDPEEPIRVRPAFTLAADRGSFTAVRRQQQELAKHQNCLKVDQSKVDRCQEQWDKKKLERPYSYGHAVYTSMCWLVLHADVNCYDTMLFPRDDPEFQSCQDLCVHMRERFTNPNCKDPNSGPTFETALTMYQLAHRPCHCDYVPEHNDYFKLASEDQKKAKEGIEIQGQQMVRCNLREVTWSLGECCKGRVHNCCWSV